MKAEWAVATDLNNVTKHEILSKVVTENAKFSKDQYSLLFKGLNPNDFLDEKLQRQVAQLSKLGVDALDEKTLNEFTEIKGNLEKFYNNAKFCDYKKPDCDLDKDGLTLDPGNVL